MKYRPLSKNRLIKLNNYLCEENWNFIYNTIVNIDHAFEILLVNIIYDAMDIYFPVKTKVANNNQQN